MNVIYIGVDGVMDVHYTVATLSEGIEMLDFL
jgi:hypothetical protein